MGKFNWEKEIENDDLTVFEKSGSHHKKKTDKKHSGKKKDKPFERKDKWDILEEK